MALSVVPHEAPRELSAEESTSDEEVRCLLKAFIKLKKPCYCTIRNQLTNCFVHASQHASVVGNVLARRLTFFVANHASVDQGENLVRTRYVSYTSVCSVYTLFSFSLKEQQMHVLVSTVAGVVKKRDCS